MNCNYDNAITIVKGNDTDWNGARFLTINLITEILDLSNFKAVLNMSGVIKTFDDLSSGSIKVNLTATETKNLPPFFNGVLNLIDSTDKVATIESLIPFKVISTVHGNAIATEPYTLNFDVKQGGETILTVNVESAVSVEVGTTTTLSAGSDAIVTNSGSGNHLVLDFGIPQGVQGVQGEQGIQGEQGEPAKINGYNAISLVAGTGINITSAAGIVTITNTQTSAEWGNITGTLSNQTDLQGELDILQGQIDNLKARGRFLALWNCATGLAETNPPESPYEYKAGDYFIVGNISSGTNYKPTGSSYTTGVASTVVETAEVSVDDVYYYDGTTWRLQVNTQKTLSFVNIAGSPYDNTNLATALNAKISGITVNSTEVQPDENHVVNLDLSGYVTTSTAQDITATKTFKDQQKFQSGSAEGCIVIGADALATTVTANKRKLGRMTFHTKASTTLNCAFVSTDTQYGSSAASDVNCVEFGGRTGDITATSPDKITFTVAKVHNTITENEKLLVAEYDKDGIYFYAQPKYNGNNLITASDIPVTDVQINSTSIVSGGVANIPYGTNAVAGLAKAGSGLASMAGGTFYIYPATDSAIQAKTNSANPIVPSNLNKAVMEGLGNNSLIWSDAYKANARNTIGAEQATNIVTLADNDTITLADNTIYNGATITAFEIVLPSTDIIGFLCEIDFSSGATATTITYSNTIKWLGDDLSDGLFVPVANKRYMVVMSYDGSEYVAVVKGIE